MNNDLHTLIEFLGHFGPQVSGRGFSAPEVGVMHLFHRFIAGHVTDEERAEICELLRFHPEWIRWLADQVKAARSPFEASEN